MTERFFILLSKKTLSRLFLLVIAVIFCFPLFQNSFPVTHDYATNLLKHLAMRDYFGRGQILPVWAPGYYYGFGGAVFNFYPPLFYGLSAFLDAVVLPPALAVNLACFMFVLASGFSMQAYLEKISSRSGALLGAAAYMVAPYHMTDLYIRGAWAELVAFVFLPLVFLGILQVTGRNTGKAFVLASLATAGLALAHPPILVIFLPIAVLYALAQGWFQKTWQGSLKAVLALGCGLGLAAFYLLPAALERQYVQMEGVTRGLLDFHRHFLHPWQLVIDKTLYPSFLSSAVFCDIEVPFNIGWAYILCGMIGFGFAVFWADRFRRGNFFIALFGLVISVFMMTRCSVFLWENFSSLKMIQFPWRILLVLYFFLGILISGIGFGLRGKWSLGLCAAGLIVLVGTQVGRITPGSWDPLPAVSSPDAMTVLQARWNEGAYLPSGAQRFNFPSGKVFDFPSGDATLDKYQQVSPVSHVFDVTVRSTALACFYNYFFPGWHVVIDGKESELIGNKYGVILFPLGEGQHRIRIFFGPTPVRVAGWVVSLICCVFLLVLFFRKPDPAFLSVK